MLKDENTENIENERDLEREREKTDMQDCQ